MNPEQEKLVQRLQEANLSVCRFLKVDETKKAFEKEWPKHLYDPKDLHNYPFWGICGKEGLVLVDTDKQEMETEIIKIFPKTFTTRSPRRKLQHFYFKIVEGEIQNLTLYLPGEKDGSGEVRAQNEYVIAPGTEIQYKDLETKEPKTGVYTIVNNLPIATIKAEDFMRIITPYLGNNPTQRLTPEEIAKGVDSGARHDRAIRYADHLIGKSKLDPNTALFELERWDKLNRPPINDRHYFERTIREAQEYITARNKTEQNFPTPFQEMGSQEIPLNFFDNKDKIIVSEVLLFLNGKYVFKATTDTETLYYYARTEGIYKEAESKIKAELERHLGSHLTDYYCKEIINHLIRANYCERSEFNRFDGELPVRNGLLNIYTATLDEFNPSKTFTYKIDIDFNIEAKCPKFLAFLESSLPEADKRQLLQEYSGTILEPLSTYQAMLFMQGSGRNGKGVFVRTLTNIIGKNFVSDVPLDSLDGNHRFVEARLYGKLMNVSSEPISKRYAFDTTLIKKLTGGDTIDAELKGIQKPLKFVNTSKFFILGNKFPHITDNTIAFWDRILFVKWEISFTQDNEKRINNLENTWLNDETERSGILNWLILGLARLRQNRIFTSPESSANTLLEFKRVSDSISAFLIEMTQADGWVRRDDLFNAYRDYAHSINAYPEGERTFATKIKDQVGVRESKKRFEGEQKRIWLGIRLTIEEMPSEDENQSKLEQNEKSGTDGTDGTHVPYSSNDEVIHNMGIGNRVPSVPSVPKLETSESKSCHSCLNYLPGEKKCLKHDGLVSVMSTFSCPDHYSIKS